MKFVFLSFKKNILPLIFFIIAILMVIFSGSNLSAAKAGLTLWASNVIPSLFPFFVITELLANTNIVFYIGKLFDKIMKPLFNVPGECAFAFIMGFITGYPTGAKIVADLRARDLCTKDEGDRMLAFTNNSGPLFIISCVGISLFGDTKTGILLLITHILAGITVGIIFGYISNKKEKYLLSKFKKFRNNRNCDTAKETVTFSSLGTLLSKSINSAISTTLLIGGFIVIFSVFISMLQQSHFLTFFSQLFKPVFQLLGLNLNLCEPFCTGIIELTNGVNLISSIHIKNISQSVVLCAFLLGFRRYICFLSGF